MGKEKEAYQAYLELLKVIDRTSHLTPTITATLSYLRNPSSPPTFKLAAIEVAKAALDVIKKEFETMESLLEEVK